MLGTQNDEQVYVALHGYAVSWARRLRSLAEGKLRRGGCTCEPVGNAVDDLTHSNRGCPIAVYAHIAKLIEDEGDEDFVKNMRETREGR